VYATVLTPTMKLGVNPTSQSAQQGQAASYSVTATGSNGFAGSVPLSVSGLPLGAKASFAPASLALSKSVTAAKSTLSVTTTSTTPVATSTLLITGVSGSTRSSISVTLTVTAPLNGGFALAAAPNSVTVAPGATVVSAVTISRTTPFAGAVALSAGSLPAGVTAPFNPSTVAAKSGSSSATLQLVASTGAKDGTYTLPIVGTYTSSTGLRYYAYSQLQLVVDSSRSPKPFTLSGGLTRPLLPGAPQPIDLSISNPNSQPLPLINLSVAIKGTSAGARCDITNFAGIQYSGPYPLTVPAGRTSTLSSLGLPPSAWPQLQMLDLPRNQDGCKNVGVVLAFSGSARGV
jgi:uncharacterized membrane protein